MRTLGNIIWILFGGLALSISWAVSGLLCCITIIGIPLGRQCFKIAGLALTPFGKEVVCERVGLGSCLGNVLWILIFGIVLAVQSFLFGIVFSLLLSEFPLVFSISSLRGWLYGRLELRYYNIFASNRIICSKL